MSVNRETTQETLARWERSPLGQHTPGPWHATSTGYVGSSHHGYVPLRSPFRPDAFSEGRYPDGVTEETLLANARLIAAAPALLAALRLVVNDLAIAAAAAGLPLPTGHTQARAAIAEAEGTP